MFILVSTVKRWSLYVVRFLLYTERLSTLQRHLWKKQSVAMQKRGQGLKETNWIQRILGDHQKN